MITGLIIFLIGLGCFLVGQYANGMKPSPRTILKVVGIVVMVIGGIFFVLGVVPSGGSGVEIDSMVTSQLG